jgi:hypothetical protein
MYNILIEFGIPMKLVRLNEMCLNETYSKAYIGKNLSDASDCLTQGNDLSPLLLSLHFCLVTKVQDKIIIP